MADAPSVLKYGENFEICDGKLYHIKKCKVCGKNTGRCEHSPKELEEV